MERTAPRPTAAPSYVAAYDRLRTARRMLAAHWVEAVVVVMTAAMAWRFAELSIGRHLAYQSNAYDLGFFDQIIWNTSRGRLFETTFVPYNFLGQHFEPVLLIFAAVYRLGGGVTTLLLTQAVVVAMAAVPLYFAARAASRSSIVGLAVASGYLLNPSLHEAVDFDFHPELMGLFFVFLALYFLVVGLPRTSMLSLLPVLLLKEEMLLLLPAFAVLMFVRGHRAEAARLLAAATSWGVAVAWLTMTLIRGGPSDLTMRYDYLTKGLHGPLLPVELATRIVTQLGAHFVNGFGSVVSETGFVALLSPIGFVMALAAGLPSGVSHHDAQAALSLHYVMLPLALLWTSVVFALGWLHGRSTRPLVYVAAAVVLVASLTSFLQSSPYAPGTQRHRLTPAHAAALAEAIALVPEGAVVSAQSSVVPQLSQRQHVYEFPHMYRTAYVVLDDGLPVSSQSLREGFEVRAENLPILGYEQIFSAEGVRVYRKQ